MKLRNKILGHTIFLVLLLGLSIILFVNTALKNSLMSELREEGIARTKQLAHISTDGILTENEVALLLTLNESIASYKEIEYVFVLDKNNDIFVHTFNEIFPEGLKDINTPKRTDPYRIQRITSDKGTLIDIAVPIAYGHLGTIHVGYSEEHIKALVNDIVKLILWIVLVVLVVVCLLAFVSSSLITNPIKELTEYARKVGSGELNGVVEIKSGDEIGRLADSFNHMVENLNSSMTSIENLNKEISERKKAEEVINRSKREWEETFNIMADAITIHDKDYNIIKANRSAIRLLGLPALKDNKVKCYEYYHGKDAPPEGCPSCECVKNGIPATFETFEPHLNKYVEIRAMPRFDSRNRVIGIIHLVRDITEKKLMEDKLKTMSLTDDLTGLYNRRGCFALLEQQLKISNRQKEKAYMLFADIDNLKEINDTLGHNTGDQAIIDATSILRSTYRESDIAARLGGDEFVVFPAGHKESDVSALTQRLQSNIDLHNNLENREYKLSMSIGIAVYDPENPCSIDNLLAKADRSMYENKRSKKKV